MPSFSRSSASRALPLQHARRVLGLVELPPLAHPSLQRLDPGYEQLLSYYAPSLTAGSYTATSTQTVTAPTSEPPLNLSTTQSFTVTAPRFSLPDGAVHSTYPPQGHGDHVETLPHLVFNDEHLPWEREAVLGTSKDSRNRVPWLALLVFTPDELTLAPSDLQAGGIFDSTGLQIPVAQGNNLEVKMTLDEIWKWSTPGAHVATPIPQNKPDQEPIDGQTPTDVVFLPPALFTSLFTTTANDSTTCDLDRYKYLAHVRNINTTGMAVSGGDGESSGVFGIVLSHRTGPTNNTQPTPVVVHLVSLEGIVDMSFPLPSDTKYVAMTSLYSWSYTSLPPTADNIFQDLEDIGDSSAKGLLRAPDNIISAATSKSPKLGTKLTDGYTLVRYRTQTGEETAALLRGALTPTSVPRPLTASWTSISNSGQDLQVLDQDLGLMDITYSSAWQLGRTLGMGDRAFVSALTRVRGQIYAEAINASKAEVLQSRDYTYKTKEETLRGLRGGIETLKTLGHNVGLDGHRLAAAPGMMGAGRRWQRPLVKMPDLAFGGEHIGPEMLRKHAVVAARRLASSTDGRIYNELNTPNSTDWMHVLKWVLDKLFLYGIPPQYLIPDPSYLPNETIRFFTIDGNWTDALIDGALSIANHSIDTTDSVRASIKTLINEYLDTPLADIGGYKPQIPTHGFLLRSPAIIQFPDLMVKAPRPSGDKRAPILRHENIDSDVMLCLFDREPGSSTFDSLTLQQPPHQQSFAAAAELTDQELVMSYKRIYTVPPDDKQGQELMEKQWSRKDDNGIYDWESRTLTFPAWADDVYNTLTTKMPDYFKDTEPTAAMCGIQLNNPIYLITIHMLDDQSGSASPSPPMEAHEMNESPRQLLLLDPPRGYKDQQVDALKSRRMRQEIVKPASQAQVLHESLMLHDFEFLQLRKRLTPIQPGPSRTPYHQRLLPVKPLRTPLHAISTTTYKPPSTLAPSQQLPKPGLDEPPRFTYTVIPAASSTGPIPIVVEPQDIVFGIVLEPNFYYRETWRLKELHISLPIGPIDGKNPPFTTSYRGPGATMLSNLRFNVAIEYGDTEMVFRLIPRSLTGLVQVGRCDEISFIVGLMEVSPWPEKTTVTMTVTEKWQWFTFVKKVEIVLEPSAAQ